MWDGCAGECSRCRATRASEETDEHPLRTMHARGRPDVRERWRTLSGADRRRHAPGGAERVRFGNPERHERGTGLEPRGPHLYLWVDHAQLPSTSALNADEGARWHSYEREREKLLSEQWQGGALRTTRKRLCQQECEGGCATFCPVHVVVARPSCSSRRRGAGPYVGGGDSDVVTCSTTSQGRKKSPPPPPPPLSSAFSPPSSK